jgi:hypothetical protein
MGKRKWDADKRGFEWIIADKHGLKFVFAEICSSQRLFAGELTAKSAKIAKFSVIFFALFARYYRRFAV